MLLVPAVSSRAAVLGWLAAAGGWGSSVVPGTPHPAPCTQPSPLINMQLRLCKVPLRLRGC